MKVRESVADEGMSEGVGVVRSECGGGARTGSRMNVENLTKSWLSSVCILDRGSLKLLVWGGRLGVRRVGAVLGLHPTAQARHCL